MTDVTDCIQVLATFPDRATALRVGGVLVEERLAACAQVGGPITSRYRWRGATEEHEEWTCALKTRADLWEALRARLAALHPYEVSEIVAIPLAAGHEPYLEWIRSGTGPRDGA